MFIFWWLLAKIISIPFVTNALIKRAKRTPYTHILSPDGNVVYMERYWLFNPYFTHEEKEAFAAAGQPVPWKYPVSIRIHCICTPDDDRAQHDHPWDARTIVMRGSYLEQRGSAYRLIEAGQTGRLRFGKDFHRIRQVFPEPKDNGVWTLFITHKYQGTWGYDVNGTKIPFKEYLRATGDANYKGPK
jgi:hypothetical protein